jgi:hypothetical protein
MPNPSQAISLDSPIGGWNTFDSLDNMPANCAVILDNLIPKAGTVDTREGQILYADLETGMPVETVASLNADNFSVLVAASAGGMWALTDSPIMTRALVTTQLAAPGTYANNKWQNTNFRKADEEGILILSNGADEVQIYEEPYTGLIDADFDYLLETPPVTPFIGSLLFKGRVYYWADNTDEFWYSQAGSYQGELQPFNLGVIAKNGGKIKFITSWTQQDSGDGKDDFLVFVMSTGEVIIYQGDNPEDIGFFEMVGKYMTAEPLSIRGSDQYGSDTIIMTKDGYIALSTIVQRGRVSDVPAFSRLISSAITDKTKYNYDFYGWDCKLFSNQSLFVFNVPISGDGTYYQQHVLNTVTMKWCRFTDMNVNCLEVHQDRLFGGTADGLVVAMLEGTSDLGESIEYMALPAFNYFEMQGYHKFVSACQIISTHSNPELIELTAFTDFNFRVPPPLTTPPSRDSCIWSIDPALPPQTIGSFWDEDYWALELSPYTTKGWQNVSGFGYAVSVMVRFRKVNEGVIWRSTGIRFNLAGAQ